MVIDIDSGKKFLIIERIGCNFYAYVEDASHHSVVQPKRLQESTLLDQSSLENECDLSSLPSNSHLIFELKN